MDTRRLRITVISIVVFIVVWSLVVYFVGAERIIDYIGVENSYIVVFFIALIGGATSLGGVTYVSAILTTVAGGAEPLYIGLAAGAGTCLGDSLYYLVSYYGSHAFATGTIDKHLDRVQDWADQRPWYTRWLTIYGLLGFTPMPNDLLTVSLGLIKQPKRLVLTAIAAGTFTLALLLAYFGSALPLVGG
jgi:membrane protein YqaA with SNARE-associated domain